MGASVTRVLLLVRAGLGGTDVAQLIGEDRRGSTDHDSRCIIKSFSHSCRRQQACLGHALAATHQSGCQTIELQVTGSCALVEIGPEL